MDSINTKAQGRYRIVEQQYKYKLAISIMTRNRSPFVRELLRKMAKFLHERNVGLYFFDGSDKDNLKYVVERYNSCGYDNIHYFYYDPREYKGDSRYINIQRGTDSREKVDAEYMWYCSDKFFPTEEGVNRVIEQLDKKYDVIVYNALYQKEDKTKEYTDAIEFFRECTMKLQMLSVPILRKNMLKVYTVENLKYCRDKKKYTDIENIFRTIAEMEKFSALLLCLDYEKMPPLLAFSREENSTHVKSATTMEFFVECVYNTISELPTIYNSEKQAVMKSISCNTWFSIEGFALLRSRNGYYLGQCMKYLDKLKFVTNVPIFIVLGISILHPIMADVLYKIIRKYKHLKGEQCFGS